MGREMRFVGICGALLVAGGWAAAGCSSDCEDTGTCVPGTSTSSSSGGGGGGEGGAATAGCVPAEAEGPVGDSCGIFVSSQGSDDAAGSKAAPLATVAAAIAKKAKRIYLCAESFKESVELLAGVSLYGGLECTGDWSYAKGKPSEIAGAANSIALRISGSGESTVADVNVTAPDATEPGASSIAVLVDTATVEIARAKLVAGKGAEGKEGAAGNTPDLQGSPGDPGQAGCTGGSGVIGGGGRRAKDVPGHRRRRRNLPQGGSGTAGGPDLTGGSGGKGQDGGSCQSGGQGADGTSGGPGLGATGLGVLSGGGYAGPSADDGKPGEPGQGGGGGGGAKLCNGSGPSGGGGGSGGCGGAGGKGGGAGGASIALASVDAAVTLSEVKLSAGDGGKGGKGGDGQAGGGGGDGGLKGGDGACPGGMGGTGGPGGPGGGGLGGHSLGIAYVGTAPVETGVSIGTGNAGAGGPGKGGGAGKPGQKAGRLDFQGG
ncbi:MAG: PGRS family protein [Deltaproteobacteria bacterium]|nr:PGRS family protein [Deltaproteobacteria bacterium]